MAFRYASGSDICYMTVGLINAFIFGASLPGFCFVFGEMIDDMVTGGPGAMN